MPQTADLIAIVRQGNESSAVWHVDVAPSTPLMRLCGAWVTDDASVLRNVVASRVVLPFGGQLDGVAIEIAKDAVGVVDLNTTLTTISEVIADLDEKHRASKRPLASRELRSNGRSCPMLSIGLRFPHLRAV
jgi:hypothetical protein